eukprot:scaffold86801_cov20-Tisochrysis_lutea.AAC.2
MSAAEGFGQQALSQLDSQIAEVEDMLSYCNDVFSTGMLGCFGCLLYCMAESIYPCVLFCMHARHPHGSKTHQHNMSERCAPCSREKFVIRCCAYMLTSRFCLPFCFPPQLTPTPPTCLHALYGSAWLARTGSSPSCFRPQLLVRLCLLTCSAS